MILLIVPITFFLLYFLFNNIIQNYGLYDKNDFIKNNDKVIGLTGGIYIFISLIVLSSLIAPQNKLYLLTLGSIGIFLMGLIDDLKDISFRSRFIFQIIFVFLYIIYFDFYILDFGIFIINNNLFLFSLIITTFAIVGLMNAFNFIDGIDGLSSSLFLMGLIFLKIYIFIDTNNIFYYQIDIMIILIICFIILNKKIFNLNQIYLGDSGSMLIGFLMSIYLIYFSNILDIISPTTAFWLVAIPIFDFFSVISIRIINRKNPMVGDFYHFHHYLINKEFSKNSILILMIILSSLFSLFGILIDNYFGSYVSCFVFVLFVFMFITLRVNLKDQIIK